MSVQEGLILPPREQQNVIILRVILVLLALALLGPITLFGGAYVCRWLKDRRTYREYGLFVGSGVLGLVLSFVTHKSTLPYYQTALLSFPSGFLSFAVVVPALASYTVICLATIPLIPTVAGALIMFEKARKFLRTYATTEEWKEEYEKNVDRRQAAIDRRAVRLTGKHPPRGHS